MIELFSFDFFRNALAGLLMISIASALIGTYIVSRRLVALCGGVTHACFGGLGLGYFLGINPLVAASLFAIASTGGVEWLSSRHNIREDSAIAVVWALGMAAGIIFVFMTPGYVPELNTFLFGNVLTITQTDLAAFGVFMAVVVLFSLVKRREIVACAFDRDFARVSGLPERVINYAMTVLMAVCIVLTIRMVGIMLLMSMFTLPQLTAEIYSRRIEGIALTSVGVSVVASAGGLLLAGAIDVPCSALIVVLMVGIYVVLRVVRQITRGRGLRQ